MAGCYRVVAVGETSKLQPPSGRPAQTPAALGRDRTHRCKRMSNEVLIYVLW
jgi:hypothetical protein